MFSALSEIADDLPRVSAADLRALLAMATVTFP